MAEFSCEYENMKQMGMVYNIKGDILGFDVQYNYIFDIRCATIWFTNAAINVTVETQGMSAIVLHNVSGTHIQLNGVCTKKQEHSQLKKIKKTLVLVYESSYICIELSVADSCTNGIVILQGRYHNISNTIVANNKF